MHQPNSVQCPLSVPSAAADRRFHHPFPFTLPFASSMAPTVSMPTNSNVVFHFSVSNCFWLNSPDAGQGTQDVATTDCAARCEENCAEGPPSSTDGASPYNVTSAAAAESTFSQKNLNAATSYVDLLCSSYEQDLQSADEQHLDNITTGTPASSNLTSMDSKECGQLTLSPSRLCRQRFDPSKKRSQALLEHAFHDSGSIEVDEEWPVRSTPVNGVPTAFGVSLFRSWCGFKKSRSKRHKVCRREVESASSFSPQESGFQKHRNNDDFAKGFDAASSCIENSLGSFVRSDESDLGCADKVSWNYREGLTSKLDQLAFIACELKAKRRRSARKQIKRHHFTIQTFQPLNMITSYWQQNRISACTQAVTNSKKENFNSAKVEGGPFNSMRQPPNLPAENTERSATVVGDQCCQVRRAKFQSSKRANRKAKTLGRQTRVQRCAKQVLIFVGEDTVREKLIRHVLGNNPDTSKALRLLLDQRKLGRIGGGGRRDPYKYKLTSDGLHELNGREGEPMMQSSNAALLSAGDETGVEHLWNKYNLQKSA